MDVCQDLGLFYFLFILISLFYFCFFETVYHCVALAILKLEQASLKLTETSLFLPVSEGYYSRLPVVF